MSQNDWNQQGSDWDKTNWQQDWSQPAAPGPTQPAQSPGGGGGGGGGNPARMISLLGSVMALGIAGAVMMLLAAGDSESQGPVTMAEADFGAPVAASPASEVRDPAVEACPFSMTRRVLRQQRRDFAHCLESARLDVPERMVISLRVKKDGMVEVLGGLPENEARECLERRLERLFVEPHEEDECVSRFEVEL